MNDYPKNNTLISENIGHKRPTILAYFDAYICHHYQPNLLSLTSNFLNITLK